MYLRRKNIQAQAPTPAMRAAEHTADPLQIESTIYSSYSGNQSALRSLAAGGLLQPKLRVGSVNDPLEAEADRMAEQLLQPSTAARPAFSKNLFKN
jgi:hypothetical protein